MENTRSCRSCGAEVGLHALGGLCPRCVGTAAFGLAETGMDEEESASLLGEIRRFGDYELIEEIARGGMGVVFRARQIELRRMVALKMIISGQFAGPAEVQRFRAEAQAAATLQHPNIVTIHEVGEHEGQHYFSMDLIEGRSLAEIAGEHPLSPRRAAKYLRKIAAAIQHAHERGILHRDLKPSNVLIDLSDEPRITDFGLAKRVKEESDLTLSGQVLGTPSFMAPEQAGGKRAELGPSADIYSLGAILYFLLTGRPPFVGETLQQTLAQVVNSEPVSLRLLNPAVPRDLETICLKCIEKEPLRRYVSAEELADELDRFLNDKPIQARPVGTLEKVWRWCKRRPAIASLSAAVILLIVGVAIGSPIALWQIESARKAEKTERLRAQRRALEEERQRHLAETNALLQTRERQRATEALLNVEFQRAEELLASGKSGEGIAVFTDLLRKNDYHPVIGARLVWALTYRNWPMPLRKFNHEKYVTSAEFSPDGKKVVTSGSDGLTKVWDTDGGKEILSIHCAEVVTGAHFSPDGSRILLSSADKTARVYDARSGLPACPAVSHDGTPHNFLFGPDGSWFLTSPGDNTLRIWDANSGAELHRLDNGRSVSQAAISPDGSQVAASSRSKLRVWSLPAGKVITEALDFRDGIVKLEFSPDGGKLFVAAWKTGYLLDSTNLVGSPKPFFAETCNGTAKFSPNGKQLVTGSEDGIARVWNVEDGRLLFRLKSDALVRVASFSADGSLVVTGSEDTTVRVWNASTGEPICEPLRHNSQVIAALCSPDSRRVLTLGDNSTQAKLWDIRPSRPSPSVVRHTATVSHAEFSPDGSTFVTCSYDYFVKVWDARRFKPVATIQHYSGVLNVHFDARGERLATASFDKTARVWDAANGQPVAPPLPHEATVLDAVFSHDGSKVVTGAEDGTARLWDAQTGQPLAPPLVHGRNVLSVQFDPEGKRVLTACADGQFRLWDASTGRLLGSPARVGGWLKGAWFNHDGTKILSFFNESAARIWDPSGKPLSEPMTHRTHLSYAEFSPDEKLIATCSRDYTARIWDAATAQPFTGFLQHGGAVHRARFSPDGTRLVTCSDDRTARVWDVRTGWAISEPLLHDEQVTSAVFSPDGQRVLTASGDGTVRLWELPAITKKAPSWLPHFCEALVQRREGQWVDFYSMDNMRTLLLKQKDKDLYTLWANWMLADRETRPPSPFKIAR